MNNKIKIEFHYNVEFGRMTEFAIFGDADFDRADIVKATEQAVEWAKNTWLLEPKADKYFWGKFKVIGEPKLIWVDKKMSREEMIEFDDTLRHNCSENLPSANVFSVEEYLAIENE